TLRVSWVLEARALAAAHELVALDSLLRVAADLEPDVYWSYGGMLAVSAEELAAHGDSLEAKIYASRAERWLRARLTARPDDPDHLNWLASALHMRGAFTEEAAVMRTLVRVDGRESYRETEALLLELTGTRGALTRLPRPAPYDRGGRLVAEAR